MGLLPAGSYISQYSVVGAEHHGPSQWLYSLSAIPALCVLGFAVWYGIAIVKGQKRLAEVAGPLLVTGLCYFLGIFLGIAIQNTEPSSHAAHDASHSEHGDTSSHEDPDAEHHDSESHGDANATEHSAEMRSSKTVLVSTSSEALVPGAPTMELIDQKAGAGLFFSIYYCMTGVHAIHILGGMLVLTWLLVRATKDHFNEEYFGPVDYVGLYWHLVDLIWIYLFPLLYLI
jgi:cytochrome c oxidase subunit III